MHAFSHSAQVTGGTDLNLHDPLQKKYLHAPVIRFLGLHWQILMVVLWKIALAA